MSTLGDNDGITCGGSSGGTLGADAIKRGDIFGTTLGAGTGGDAAQNVVAAGRKSKVTLQFCFRRCDVAYRAVWMYGGLGV